MDVIQTTAPALGLLLLLVLLAWGVRKFRQHLVPGGAGRLRPPSERDAAHTLVLALPIERWSLKVADGWPYDAADPEAGEGWAGVVPLVTTWGEAVPAPGLQPPIEPPDEIRTLVGRPA